MALLETSYDIFGDVEATENNFTVLENTVEKRHVIQFRNSPQQISADTGLLGVTTVVLQMPRNGTYLLFLNTTAILFIRDFPCFFTAEFVTCNADLQGYPQKITSLSALKSIIHSNLNHSVSQKSYENTRVLHWAQKIFVQIPRTQWLGQRIFVPAITFDAKSYNLKPIFRYSSNGRTHLDETKSSSSSYRLHSLVPAHCKSLPIFLSTASCGLRNFHSPEDSFWRIEHFSKSSGKTLFFLADCYTTNFICFVDETSFYACLQYGFLKGEWILHDVLEATGLKKMKIWQEAEFFLVWISRFLTNSSTLRKVIDIRILRVPQEDMLVSTKIRLRYVSPICT